MSGAAFLDEMAAGSRERVRAARQVRSEAALTAEALRAPAAPALRITAGGFDLIAELKLRSPAAGRLGGADEDLAARVVAYAQAGAAAISVLTEPERFEGSLEHLSYAARALSPLGVPAMRKDFLVDPYQVLEARAAGAGGVLIILRMLPRSEIGGLLECASSLGLFVLLEAFDADDIGLMRELISAHRGANPLLAGVNCRDLETLRVAPQRLAELGPLLPSSVPKVAESGVGSPEDARRVAALGYDLALVGSSLMQARDPGAFARSLLAAGRAARGVA